MLKLVEKRPYGAFRESKPRSGLREAILIKAGWGSSGYYPNEVLEEYGPGAWPEGTHMHLNHATFSEEIERPERDVKDLVGTIASKPRMAGSDLVGEAKVFEHWKPVIDEIWQDIGLSVVGMCVMENGDAGGRHGPIIQEVHPSPINAVDYVTIAGAGGQIGKLMESARGNSPREDELTDETIKELLREADTEKLQVLISDAETIIKRKESRSGTSGGKRTKETKMEVEELQRKLSEAEGKVTTLEGEVEESKTKLSEAVTQRDEEKDRADRAEDALLISGAKSIAREVVDRIEGLPERAQDRIVEKAVREIPKDDKGRVNEDALKTRTKEAAKSELEYLAGKELEGDLPIRESGGSTTVTTTTANNGGGDSTEKLEEAFKASGMSEDAAKIAARGR